MPAPDSILVRSKERKPFAPVDKAIELYKKVREVCLKMPKRYTFFGLKETEKQAGKVMDLTKIANSIFIDMKSEDIVDTVGEMKRRIKKWKKAREHLQALSTRIDRFYDAPGTLTYRDNATGKTKGVSQKELEAIIDLIIEENNYINKAIDREKKQLKQYKEKHNI